MATEPWVQAGLSPIKRWKSFGGDQLVFAHDSKATGTRMEFAVYVPPQAAKQPWPVLFYLSGLTCTWENVTTKAGFQHAAAEHGMVIVAPDTSPRGDDVADDSGYDLGKGAGFYLNATQAPWSKHFKMYDYVVQELTELVARAFPVNFARFGITGHSMGGHGALTIAMKNPDRFKSVSAFSPIVAPSQVPWGQKAFQAYLGPDQKTWADYDSCALMASRGWSRDILIDQGDADEFLAQQLRPELFAEACKARRVPLTLRMQAGYDHSYYFISTFMAEHVRWHAERLHAS
ncbi:S-formylglutathione hydrolase [Dongia deserti]|uniref:S-formylglutathione hydrolase n=1 Tax=Dongia deserti TaxID=2268030 RepID=UPI000E64F79C|nr:S-formylglutathione hydrolase [Dongia deserti]